MNRFRHQPNKTERIARLRTYLANLPDATLFAHTADEVRRVIDVPAKEAEYYLLLRQQARRIARDMAL